MDEFVVPEPTPLPEPSYQKESQELSNRAEGTSEQILRQLEVNEAKLDAVLAIIGVEAQSITKGVTNVVV